MLLFENAFNERTVRIEIESGECLVLGEPLAGYALVRRVKGITDITRLAVHPKYQGQGFGTRLLLEALRVPGPHMLTVRKDNRKAIHLYKKHSFKIVADLPDAPAWIMKRVTTGEN